MLEILVVGSFFVITLGVNKFYMVVYLSQDRTDYKKTNNFIWLILMVGSVFLLTMIKQQTGIDSSSFNQETNVELTVISVITLILTLTAALGLGMWLVNTGIKLLLIPFMWIYYKMFKKFPPLPKKKQRRWWHFWNRPKKERRQRRQKS